MTYPAADLTQRQLVLLRIVWSHGPASGSTLREPFRDAAEVDIVSEIVYDELGTLASLGYVEKREQGWENEYACTHEGARLLWDVSAWLVDDVKR